MRLLPLVVAYKQERGGNMLDQLIIGDKASLDDFEASLSGKVAKPPKKKTVKETIPFSDRVYDFSKINGEFYWEERELKYQFEITADSPEQLERKRAAFADWVMNVADADIYDPYIPDFHYVGTYSDMSYSDDETLEKTTVTVKFTAYPYAVSNEPKTHKYTVPAGEELTAVIVNDSSHRITPTFIIDQAVTVKLDNVSWAIPSGEITSEAIKLQQGANVITFNNGNSTASTVTVKFFEEVF